MIPYTMEIPGGGCCMLNELFVGICEFFLSIVDLFLPKQK